MRHYYFPVHVVALVSLWLEFKNSVKVEIGVLYWQPFMNIHQFCCTGSPDFAFKTIHEEPFPLSHLCRISRIPSYSFSRPHK